MTILSHRGYWKDPTEKNGETAFERSFSLGFGTETDLRDRGAGGLVISHDVPGAEAMPLDVFFEIFNAHDPALPLALNIKADGLQNLLAGALARHEIGNYFVFDMSVPDGLHYLRAGIRAFTRQSEYEREPSFYEAAAGVWLDEFHGHWIDEAVIAGHLRAGKSVCIVSPDLHKREFREEWAHYQFIEQKLGTDGLMLCTDFPEDARDFFG